VHRTPSHRRKPYLGRHLSPPMIPEQTPMRAEDTSAFGQLLMTPELTAMPGMAMTANWTSRLPSTHTPGRSGSSSVQHVDSSSVALGRAKASKSH
jgi:hypothetical protein